MVAGAPISTAAGVDIGSLDVAQETRTQAAITVNDTTQPIFNLAARPTVPVALLIISL